MTDIVDLISKLNYWLGHTVQSGPTWYEFVPDLQKAVTALGEQRARIRELEAERDEWEATARQATSMHATSVAAAQAQCKAIEAATIERCAQAVMDHGGGNAIWHAEAIRALKAPGKEGE